MFPTFCQEGARYFLKLNEKIANLQRSRGRGQNFSFMPHTGITLATRHVLDIFLCKGRCP